MGLFSKDKDKKTEDLKTTQEIKDISNDVENFPQSNSENLNNQSPNNSLPELNLNQNQQNTQPQNDFVNPFANETENHQTQQTNQTQELNLNLNNQPENILLPEPSPIQSQQTNQNQTQRIPELNTPPIEELTNTNSQTNQNEQKSIFNLNNNQQTLNQTNLEQPSQLPSDLNPIQTPQQTPNQTTQTQTQTNNSQPDPIQQLQPQANNSAIPKDQIQEIVDETVEQVIEERWQDIVKKIEKVASWKDKQEQHINLIKEDIVTMKDSFDKLEKRIIDKVSSYDKNILDVNSEIKALEKVFQKITPTLVNNVNELSNIAKTFKEDSDTDKIE